MKTVNEEFKNYTIEGFNKKYKAELVEGMDVQEVTDYLEDIELNYMYASFRSEDVLSEYRDFYKDSEHECDLVCIDGLYIALY